MSDDEIEQSRMPLIDHLIELRRRLIYCVVAIVVLFFVCYWFAPTSTSSSFSRWPMRSPPSTRSGG